MHHTKYTVPNGPEYGHTEMNITFTIPKGTWYSPYHNGSDVCHNKTNLVLVIIKRF